ncbi:hypothetical protein AB0B39_12280 [Micromonospora sp. NPDC049114]|uniref:hypothetical protein n=1 Tax=unclassified Micromonospora TaxID=2617518 RepID=UPI0033C63227
MTNRIDVTLYWLRTGTTGRLVARRRMTWSGGDEPVDEIWASGSVDGIQIATVDHAAQSTVEWQRLLAGMAVLKLTVVTAKAQLVLRLLDADALESLAGTAAPATLFARVTTQFEETDGVLQAAGGHLNAPGRHLVAQPLLPVLRAALQSVNLAKTDVPPPARPAEEPAPALRECLPPAIKFERTRGAQVGHHNVQINRFEVRGPTPSLDLERVLSRLEVKAARTALLADPTNAARRTDFVESLQRISGWAVKAKPLVLSATSRPPSFLERVFSVEGLQVGNGNTQRNTFKCCVTDVPAAQNLLNNDRALARSLADYLCPRSGTVGDFSTFREDLQRTMRNLPITLTNPHSVRLPIPEPGQTLIVRDIDGVSIGPKSAVTPIFVNRSEAPKPYIPPSPAPPQVHPPNPADELSTRTPEPPHRSIPGPGSFGF